MWVGKTTTQEECANERASELEAKLASGNVPASVTRTREVQEHESSYFQSLFKLRGGLQYVEPVVLNSQTNLREDVQATKLYHLKGRRNIRVKQVEVTHASLNSGDVFVLDANQTIFQWNGSKASRMEKAKALDLTVRLRDERMNRLKAHIVLVEDGQEEDDFWTALGGKGAIASADDGGDDELFERASVDEVKLFRVEEADGAFNKVLVDTNGKALHRDMLKSESVFIVDSVTEIFVWTGRQSPINVRDKALTIASSFLQDNGRPNWTPITRVSEGHETILFKGKFQGIFKEFVDNPEALAARSKSLNRTATTQKQEAVNIDAMHNPEKYSMARGENVNDKIIPTKSDVDKGELKIWYVKKNAKHELPLEEYGLFYSGESYIVLYSVTLKSGGQRHVIYYWQGRHSSTEDQGTSALLSTNLRSSLEGMAAQVRVLQNKEPNHFLEHFEGSMTVRRGSRATWETEYGSNAVLFHVRGTNAVDTRAAQLKTAAASLNSNDAFVLKSAPGAGSAAWVWLGKGANEFERSVAKTVAGRVLAGATFETIEEGSETDAFWTTIGGKGEYSSDERLQKGDIKARLFQCSDSSSVFRVIEIHHFGQEDLDNDDVMILDGFNEVFVWIGSGSTEREKAMGVTTAHEYLKAAKDGRPENVPVHSVMAKEEPPQFALYFLGWDDAAAKAGEDHYTRSLARMHQGGYLQMSAAASTEVAAIAKAKQAYHTKAKEEHAKTVTTPAVSTTEAKSEPKVPKQPVAAASSPAAAAPSSAPSGPLALHPFERLKTKPYPEGVDGAHLERHLSPEEFQTHFKMTHEAFASSPAWKQLRIKKDLGLF